MTDKELLGKIKESRERILNERSFQMKCAFLNSSVELDYLDWLIKELLGKIKESRERILDERSFQKKCIFLNSSVELDYLDWLIEHAEKAEKYREALEFYADENIYSARNKERAEITLDYGEKARKALEGKK